mgnify:CR=1 FL=1
MLGGLSLSARRAWIEMQSRWQPDGQFPVALRKESVDRNILAHATSRTSPKVALRKESVDRNPKLYKALAHVRVALRKESVDRNVKNLVLWYIHWPSLSARRAWIEIMCIKLNGVNEKVALRKESVDRNEVGKAGCNKATVALRKESVDRNPYC